MNPDLLYDTAAELLECVRTSVASTLNGVPKHVHVDFGTVADDDCCDGALTVALVNTYLSKSFPTPDTSAMNCGAPWTVATYAVRLVRCALTLTPSGHIPSDAALQRQAREMMQDMYALMVGTVCCVIGWQEEPNWRETTITQAVPIGPEGACVGAELTLVVGFTDPCIC